VLVLPDVPDKGVPSLGALHVAEAAPEERDDRLCLLKT
jgi:hypothetical protein